MTLFPKLTPLTRPFGTETFRPRRSSSSGAGRRRVRSLSAFTLAEVLAALAFMAIVIPVAIEGLRIAQLAGQVSLRKASATRIGEQVLNEWIAQGESQNSNLRGTRHEGVLDFRWSIRTEPWNQDTMRIATAEVIYTAQGQEYDVRISTLIDNSSR